MTQIETIQMNIHNTRVELNKYRRVVIQDELQRLQIESAIEETLKELKELKECLAIAIKEETDRA